MDKGNKKPLGKVQILDLEEIANELISDDFLDSFSPEIGVMAATATSYGVTVACTDSCGSTSICC